MMQVELAEIEAKLKLRKRVKEEAGCLPARRLKPQARRISWIRARRRINQHPAPWEQVQPE